jgi:peroxiredoxin
MHIRTLSLRTLVTGMLLLLGSFLFHATAGAATTAVAPDFALKSRTGENLKLSEFRGDVVMINFWASWCGPCRQEMPLLDTLYKRYSQLGFTLLGVNVEEDSKAAEVMLKDVPVSFHVLFDNQNKVSKLYDVNAMPTTIIIDRDGKVRHVHKGFQPGYELEYEKQIKALILE